MSKAGLVSSIADFFWAKTGDSDTTYHPLFCHMLDVAAVAGRIWSDCLTSSARKRLQNGLSVDNTQALLMFLAGAHDIGKANPAFQKLRPEYHGLDESMFSKNDILRPHGHVSAAVLTEFLQVSPRGQIAGGHHGVFPRAENLQMASDTLGDNCWNLQVLLWGQIAGGHHGVFPRAENLEMASGTLGENNWTSKRTAILTEFARIVGLNLDELRDRGAQGMVNDPGLVPLLAGLISVADWIGSNESFFPNAKKLGEARQIDSDAYWAGAQESANMALTHLGWLPGVQPARETSFSGVFPDYTPNSLQRVAARLALKQNSPYLMIVEAPMGLGKTEAALYAADLAMCRGFARGMYIAMPTQATGNKMFNRVREYLYKRGHRGKLNLQLVHGNALLSTQDEPNTGEITDYRPSSIEIEEEESADLTVQSWFTARRRPLLAPFGVGTIDQSLLAVLQTRHWFVRMMGLAGKVVIFDEVHAYDTYMTTILERLLRWLAELDCTVIMLSATLPDARRRVLVQAYSGGNDPDYRRYPRITVAWPKHYLDEQNGKKPACIKVPKERSYRVTLRFQSTDLAVLAETLAKELGHGGCAAVVCNTVGRSIETYEYLHKHLCDTECMLFHARTLQKWRREREEEVERKFGKGEKQPDGTYRNPDRPFRAVLVATQVIEQSLDLDFDLMFSEIAPIDLLLQRAGRMHRHPRTRPLGLERPCFTVLCDAYISGPPPDSFGKGIEYVYDRYVLLRTWLVLRQRHEIGIPDDIETLIEAVYDLNEPSAENGWAEALSQCRQKMESEHSESEKAARNLLVAKPQAPSDLVNDFNSQLIEDEDPEVHQAVRAATREGEPSVTVILLPEGEILSDSPDLMEVRRLLENSVSLSHPGIFGILQKKEPPDSWARSAYLRYCRLVYLDENEKGWVGKYVLTVNKQLGVVINTEE